MKEWYSSRLTSKEIHKAKQCIIEYDIEEAEEERLRERMNKANTIDTFIVLASVLIVGIVIGMLL